MLSYIFIFVHIPIGYAFLEQCLLIKKKLSLHSSLIFVKMMAVTSAGASGLRYL